MEIKDTEKIKRYPKNLEGKRNVYLHFSFAPSTTRSQISR